MGAEEKWVDGLTICLKAGVIWKLLLRGGGKTRGAAK
jgi:hypothetical protein